MFRWAQYYGAYVGNHSVREVSRKVKSRYFYPRVTDMAIKENMMIKIVALLPMKANSSRVPVRIFGIFAENLYFVGFSIAC